MKATYFKIIKNNIEGCVFWQSTDPASCISPKHDEVIFLI